jgi:hypothetical protein
METTRSGTVQLRDPFDTSVRELLLAVNHEPFVKYETRLRSEAELAVHTPDHHRQLLYVACTHTLSEPVTFLVEGGSVSMLAVQLG